MIATRAEVIIAMGKGSSMSDADVALLDMVHPLAESAIVNYIQQDIGYAQHTEYLPIGQMEGERDNLEDVRKEGTKAVFVSGKTGHQALQLKHLPVVLTGLQVWEDTDAYAGQASDAFSSDDLLTEGTDYYLDVDDGANDISRTGLIYRYGAWPNEPRTVKVTYYGGFTDAQLNGNMAGAIKLAAIQTVVAAYKSFKAFQGSATGPKQSESIGKYSYTNAAGSIATQNMTIDVPFSARALLQPFRNYGRLFA